MNVRTLLVRRGEDEKRRRDPKTGQHTHTLIPVYSEMILQIARDYSGLPDIRTLTLSEIRFFYDGLRPELRKATAPKANASK